MLFIDFSSAFNTISPMKLMGLEYHTVQLDIGLHHKQIPESSVYRRSCVVNPLLFTLYTYDCNPSHGGNFVDGRYHRISNNDKNLYQKEINNLANWCTENNLLLSVSKHCTWTSHISTLLKKAQK